VRFSTIAGECTSERGTDASDGLTPAKVRSMIGRENSLECRETGEVVASRIVTATGFFERLVGLLGRTALAEDAGLWLEPCDGVHTFFMRFPIDVAVLDGHGRVLRCIDSLPPWRVTRLHPGARACVEFAAGTLARRRVRPGDHLHFAPAVAKEGGAR
jgi:hypothetical protein